MLHYETIHPDTLELLKKIQSLEMFKEARLVGGTALALQLGHRKSIDLDFFGNVDASLAGIKDIAAMKLSAITNRGTRKDFVDFYFLLKLFSFDELINLYVQKYSDAQLFTTLKSLTYFDDAEQDPMPLMLSSLNWEDVKSLIVSEVGRFLKK